MPFMTLPTDLVYKNFESNRRTDYRLILILHSVFAKIAKLGTCEIITCKKKKKNLV